MYSADYAVSRRLSVHPSVRPSICPSITRRYSVDTAEHTEHTLRNFLPLGSPTVLVFPYQMCNSSSPMAP